MLLAKKSGRKWAARFKADASVLLSRIKGAELRLTTINTLFVTYQDCTEFPYLNGDAVRFSSSTFYCPPEAVEAAKKILLKQKEIREKHKLDFDEDESVYTYS